MLGGPVVATLPVVRKIRHIWKGAPVLAGCPGFCLQLFLRPAAPCCHRVTALISLWYDSLSAQDGYRVESLSLVRKPFLSDTNQNKKASAISPPENTHSRIFAFAVMVASLRAPARLSGVCLSGHGPWPTAKDLRLPRQCHLAVPAWPEFINPNNYSWPTLG